jgi:type IV secretory pathway TraG/TraD family ATPase VirD4
LSVFGIVPASESLGVAAVIAAMLLPIGAGIWRREHQVETLRRGARVLESARRRRRRWRRRGLTAAEPITLAGVALEPLDETKHCKLIGTTGTGKSTAIRQLLEGALRRGDRAVISDPDGGYRALLYRRYRGDVVLNPFERDSMRWDPYAEIHDAYDIEQLASALIPHSEDPSTQEWRAYARTFFAALVRECSRRRNRSLSELWRLLAMASHEELRPLVANSPAQPFLEADNARMFGSIRSVLLSALAGLEYITRQRASALSVRTWVREGRGVLFMPYRAGQIAALRSLIATWMRLAIVETMNQPESRDQRLWFIIDELDALGPIDGLKDALARIRKFGGRCVLGFQSVAQVAHTYGAGEAHTIIENCSNTLILRCSSSENGGTSQFASRLIGEREVIRRQTTRGHDRDSGFTLRARRRSVQISEQYATEPALMPSQIEQLPDMSGYLKLASAVDWRRVSIRR